MTAFFWFLPILSLFAPLIFIYLFYKVYIKKDLPFEITDGDKNGVTFPKYFVSALAGIILSLNIFLYEVGGVGIGTSLFFFISVLCLVFLSDLKKHATLVWALTILSAILAFFTTVRANEFVQTVNILTLVAILLLVAFLTVFEDVYWKGLWLLKSLYLIILRMARNLPLIMSTSSQGGKNHVTRILKVTILTTLTAAFFLGVLAQADPVFKKLTDDFIDQLFGRLLLSLLIGVAMVVLFASRVRSGEENSSKIGFLHFYDLFIPATVLVTIFAVFIIVQLRYLFGSHAYVQDFDLTYSEYVRKGFTELLVASFFGALLSYLFILKQKIIDHGKQAAALKGVTAVLILELLMLLYSAFIRDKIYVDTYGLTRVRLIGVLFLFWLAGVFITLQVLNLWNGFKEKYLYSTMFILGFAVLAIINVVNIDNYIISQKRPFTEYSPQDYFYINLLSEDAVEGWDDSVNFADDTLSRFIAVPVPGSDDRKLLTDVKLSLINLKYKRDSLDKAFADEVYVKNTFFKEDPEIPESVMNSRKWQSLNLSKKQAYDFMQTNRELFYGKVDCLLNELDNYQVYYNIDLFQEEDHRLNKMEYPFIFNRAWYHPTGLSQIRNNVYNRSTGNPIYNYPSPDILNSFPFSKPSACNDKS